VPKPVKAPYQSPELRVYGTLRELTLTGGGPAQDTNPNNSSAPHHSTVAA